VRSEGDGGPVRLLVVDDEPDVRRLFERRFRRDVADGRMLLRFAESGREALEVLASDPGIEVVITDLNMPEMDGFELLGRIQAIERPLRTIVLTAYGDMPNIRRAMRQGAFDFQVKPLDVDDLRATVAKACAIVRDLRRGAAAEARATALESDNVRLRDLFGRYVSEAVVEQIVARPERPVLGGERRRLTLLMADIRGFTRLTEALPADRVVTVLNGYLETASACILSRGGTINEIHGDGLLAFFGAPLDDPAAAAHAVVTAVELQLAMRDLNERHRRAGLPELAVGVGVHTGEATVGTFGGPRRMKYGVVGHHVNLVGRIEATTVGGQILISSSTHAEVRDVVAVSGRFTIQAKGVGEPLEVVAVRGIGGPYGRFLPRKTSALRSLHPPVTGGVARVVDKRVGPTAGCDLVAAGADALRLRTDLLLGPLDDAVVTIDGVTLHGRVGECDVEADGRCSLTLVLADAPEIIRDALERLGVTELS
jgi:adenylate cyclase